MNQLYHIVPRNDEVHYLCVDKENNFVLQHKAKVLIDVTPLEFSTVDCAMEFLEEYNLFNEYKPEEFWK